MLMIYYWQPINYKFDKTNYILYWYLHLCFIKRREEKSTCQRLQANKPKTPPETQIVSLPPKDCLSSAPIPESLLPNFSQSVLLTRNHPTKTPPNKNLTTLQFKIKISTLSNNSKLSASNFQDIKFIMSTPH